MPKNFEQYSFSRMFNFNNLEFFFILGINNSDDFGDEWDSTSINPLGYLVMFTDYKQRIVQANIYLTVEDGTDEIIKYSKQFVSRMPLLPDAFNFPTKYVIKKSEVKQKSVRSPYRDFILKVLKDDFDASVLDKINF